MKIKSWQIALVGLIGLFITPFPGLGPTFGPGAVYLVLFYLASFCIGIISMILLYFNKTKGIGAALSLLLGLVGIIPFFLGMYGAIFFLAASIYYFKVESKIKS